MSLLQRVICWFCAARHGSRDPAKARPFLPSDKQFLITRNVPCQKRAATLGASCGEETDVYPEGDEGWVATIRNLDLTDSDAPRMTENSVPARDAASAAEAELDGMGVDLYDDDEGTLCDRETNIIKTRTYDVSISYDKYYQSARVWLCGYTEDRQPLSQEQVLEDISSDHALKTVTLEAHPHVSSGSGLHASIHPCKHAVVMHKLCAELANGGREVTSEQYMFLFLKFISCVIPTIEYDYTFAVDGL